MPASVRTFRASSSSALAATRSQARAARLEQHAVAAADDAEQDQHVVEQRVLRNWLEQLAPDGVDRPVAPTVESARLSLFRMSFS
mgnify:CR=1 FL=1